MSDYPIKATAFLKMKNDTADLEKHIAASKKPVGLAGPSAAKVGRYNFLIKTGNFSKVKLEANAGAEFVHDALTSVRMTIQD